jgi:hypothetical protein
MPPDRRASRGVRVMITAAGTVTAQSLIKALRDDGRTDFIAGTDMNPNEDAAGNFRLGTLLAPLSS